MKKFSLKDERDWLGSTPPKNNYTFYCVCHLFTSVKVINCKTLCAQQRFVRLLHCKIFCIFNDSS